MQKLDDVCANYVVIGRIRKFLSQNCNTFEFQDSFRNKLLLIYLLSYLHNDFGMRFSQVD